MQKQPKLKTQELCNICIDSYFKKNGFFDQNTAVTISNFEKYKNINEKISFCGISNKPPEQSNNFWIYCFESKYLLLTI